MTTYQFTFNGMRGWIDALCLETPKRKAEESTENASKLAASEPKPKSKKLSKGSKGSKIQSAKRNS